MTGRRVPVKIAPSPAGEKPENKAVEEMVKTSQKLQKDMRGASSTHAAPKPKEASTSPKVKSEPKPKPKPEPATKTKIVPSDTSTRLSFHCPINLTMDNEAARIASNLGKDAEYVIDAFIKPAKAALVAAWKAGNLKDYTSNAQLLMKQSADGGTRKLVSKHMVKDALIADMRNLFDDPLGLTSPNQTYASFLGAALMEQLKRREQ